MVSSILNIKSSKEVIQVLIPQMLDTDARFKAYHLKIHELIVLNTVQIFVQ